MQRKSRKNSSLLILGILVFAGLIFILFSTYQSWLNVKFEQQVMENYTAYIESEGVQFQGLSMISRERCRRWPHCCPSRSRNRKTPR